LQTVNANGLNRTIGASNGESLAAPTALNRSAEVLLFDAVCFSAAWTTGLNVGHDSFLDNPEGVTIKSMGRNAVSEKCVRCFAR
jgi:hypothetical protein